MQLLTLLFKLAAQAGFQIEGGLDNNHLLTVSVDGVTLEEALEITLRGQPYVLNYNPQIPGPLRHLQRLHLGISPETAYRNTLGKRLTEGDGSADDSATPPPPSAEALLARASPSGFSASETKTPLAADEVAIHAHHNLVTIDVQRLPRRELIATLAQRTRIALDDQSTIDPPITLNLTGVALETALEHVAGDTPYALIYAPTKEGTAAQPAQLRFGIAAARSYVATVTTAARALHVAELPNLSALTTSEQVAALAQLQPSPAALPLLAELMTSSVDRDVRIEAMAVLENIDSPQTLPLLESQLTSDDREIVLAAIDSLEFAGDAKQIPALRRLQSHPDQSVRQAAQAAIEFLH